MGGGNMRQLSRTARHNELRRWSPADWHAMVENPAFQSLVSRKRRFLITSWLIVAGSYFALLAGASWAPDWFAIPLWGEFNVGLLLAFGETCLVLLVAALYVRRACRDYDTCADALSRQFKPRSDGLSKG